MLSHNRSTHHKRYPMPTFIDAQAWACGCRQGSTEPQAKLYAFPTPTSSPISPTPTSSPTVAQADPPATGSDLASASLCRGKVGEGKGAAPQPQPVTITRHSLLVSCNRLCNVRAHSFTSQQTAILPSHPHLSPIQSQTLQLGDARPANLGVASTNSSATSSP
jgi:hypothetical protein